MATPPLMSPHDKLRIKAAAYHARRLFPGPIGDLIAREFFTWVEFGYRMGNNGLVHQAVDAILKMDVATDNERRREWEVGKTTEASATASV